MKKLKHLFGEVPMTWPLVILLAVASAVLTAVLNLLPFLKDTSFRDIAVNPDAWFLFAVFIAVNCRKWWEAGLKCFGFFLVSQPLIYLIEVPFVPLGWEIFQYYGYWFKVTLLTLPGAAIAFFLKKKNWFSVAILFVATAYLGFAAVSYLDRALLNFPHHLFSAVFCLALAVFFILVLLDQKSHRGASFILLALVIAVSLPLTGILKGRPQETLDLPEGEWNCTVSDPGVAFVTFSDEDSALISATGNGNALLTFTDRNGAILEYDLTVSGHSLFLSERE